MGVRRAPPKSEPSVVAACDKAVAIRQITADWYVRLSSYCQLLRGPGQVREPVAGLALRRRGRNLLVGTLGSTKQAPRLFSARAGPLGAGLPLPLESPSRRAVVVP